MLNHYAAHPKLNQYYKLTMFTQFCLTFCDSLDYRLPGSSVHGIFQATILEWVAMPSSRGSSRPRN